MNAFINRILPFAGFSTLSRPPFEDDGFLELNDVDDIP